MVVACLLLGAAVSGCDHASRHRSKVEPSLYSVAEVRRAFASAGLPLGPNLIRGQPTLFPKAKDELGEFVSGDYSYGSDYVGVSVYRSTTESHVVITLGEQAVTSSRNVTVEYPKQRSFSVRVRRALQILRRSG